MLMAVLLASPLYGEVTGKKRAVVVPGVSLFEPMATGATLTLNPATTVTFPTSDPLTPVTATMTATLNLTTPSGANSWTLSIEALGANLTGTYGTIPIGQISWTVTACKVLGGTGTCVPVAGSHALTISYVQTASGRERIGGSNTVHFVAEVDFTFTFTDNWNYSADTYSQSVQLYVNAP